VIRTFVLFVLTRTAFDVYFGVGSNLVVVEQMKNALGIMKLNGEMK
jgi:hypothetical protein